jgi:DNA polymerase-3 subunit alpha
MADRQHRTDSSPHHLVLLCKDMTGYQNLISLVSRAWIDGFYTKPRVDLELLSQKSEGLIALSACLSGQIPRLLVAGDYEGALGAARRHVEIFGRRIIILRCRITASPSSGGSCRSCGASPKSLASALSATNDAHYLRKPDSRMQHVLMCIQTGSTVDQSNMEFATDEFYVNRARKCSKPSRL